MGSMFPPLGQLVRVPVCGEAYMRSPGPINQGHLSLTASVPMPQSQPPTAPETFPDLSSSNSHLLYPPPPLLFPLFTFLIKHHNFS